MSEAQRFQVFRPGICVVPPLLCLLCFFSDGFACQPDQYASLVIVYIDYIGIQRLFSLFQAEQSGLGELSPEVCVRVEYRCQPNGLVGSRSRGYSKVFIFIASRPSMA